jgi:hypothetical protein
MGLPDLWSGALPNTIFQFAEVEWSLWSGIVFLKVKLSQTNPKCCMQVCFGCALAVRACVGWNLEPILPG